MNESAIHVLLIEDNPTDVLLLRQAFAGVPLMPCTFTHVERLGEGLKCLSEAHFDVVLLDLGLPDSQGLDTFHQVSEHAAAVPIVVFSGLDDEAVAVQAVREGAQDYLPKGQLAGPLLARAIRYAIERHQILEERKQLIRELQEALATVKTLKGLLPICARCKKIRDDQGYWNQLEIYIEAHSDAAFTHGICPDCKTKVYPELYGES